MRAAAADPARGLSPVAHSSGSAFRRAIVSREHSAAARAECAEEIDERRGVAETVRAECREVVVASCEQAAGEGHHCVPSDAATAQHQAETSAHPDATVAVGEGVDGFELGVTDRSLHHHRHIVAVEVGDEVFYQVGYAARVPGARATRLGESGRSRRSSSACHGGGPRSRLLQGR